MLANQILGALALFTTTAHAHITLAQPQPFGNPDNSPLSSAGIDFPCKSNKGFSASTSTKMVSGQSQTVSFSGTAVHNGGSCQLSLTKDKAPTASSKFKVIYSIMGGCPGVSGGTASYQFKVPEEVPNGDYTFSWSWMNNLGNREFYQNCAPVTVSGSSARDDSAFNSLPDMAVYNIKSVNQCSTVETKDVQFPNPGKYVQIAPNAKLAPPTGSGCGSSNAAAVPASSSSSGSGNSGMYGSGSGAGAGAGGSFAEGPASGASSASSAVPAVAPAPVPVPAPAPAPAAPATPAGATNCSINGAVVCSTDGNAFGLCNWGLVAYQAVAKGTKCMNGSIMKRSSWEG